MYDQTAVADFRGYCDQGYLFVQLLTQVIDRLLSDGPEARYSPPTFSYYVSAASELKACYMQLEVQNGQPYHAARLHFGAEVWTATPPVFELFLECYAAALIEARMANLAAPVLAGRPSVAQKDVALSIEDNQQIDLLQNLLARMLASFDGKRFGYTKADHLASEAHEALKQLSQLAESASRP
ncbi:MAG: hypothetical protein KDE59_12000 [Anaerolineales bacterium]|nr:hypothetical protein [Anaerolineales bacterium]